MANPIELLEAFPSRLLLALHGVPEASLRSAAHGGRSVMNVIEQLVEDEIRLLVAVRGAGPAANAGEPEPAASLDGAGEELRALRRMVLARLARPHVRVAALAEEAIRRQEARLGEIEEIKHQLGLEASTRADVARVEASDGAGAAVRSPGEGIAIRTLWAEGVRRALRVDIAAGAAFPELDHHVPGPEEVWVISGDFDDGVHNWPAGTFIHHPAGSSHVPASRGGCSLLVFYPEG